MSWHADSTLEHFSTIGVYHCTSPATTTTTTTTTTTNNSSHKATTAEVAAVEDESWRVALRVWYDAEGPNATRAVSSRAGEMSATSRIAPALAVPLPSGAAYFLLDDFNHHHQHAGTVLLWCFLSFINAIKCCILYIVYIYMYMQQCWQVIRTATPALTASARRRATPISLCSPSAHVCFRYVLILYN